jgi:hypothetical protein
MPAEAGSAQNSDGPNREVVAGTANIEYRARSGAVGTLESLEKDVIQPSNPRGRRAALGRPRVANITRDPSDTWVVEVAPDHDAWVSRGIRQDRLQLVAPRRWRQARHGAQVE